MSKRFHEGACRRHPFWENEMILVIVNWITGKLIVGRENFLQLAQCFYDKMSQFSVKLRDPLLDDNVVSFLNLSSARNFWKIFHKKKFSQTVVWLWKFLPHKNFPLGGKLILFPINLSACMGMRLQYFVISYIVHIKCGAYLTTKHFAFRSIHSFVILFLKHPVSLTLH